MRISLLKFSFWAFLPMCVVAAAHADTVTDIAIGSAMGGFSGSWNGQPNSSQILAAPTTGNTGTGINFAYWNGTLQGVGPNGSLALDTGGVALGSVSTVNALLSNFYGDGQQDALVTFTNSNGDTASYSVNGGDTIRDFNQNNFQNSLNGGSVAGGVTAQNWWNNGGNGQRLDVATFYLPTSWAGSNLTSFSLVNTSTSGAYDILSGLQTDVSGTAVTPEPSSLMLLGTGVVGCVGAMRRRFMQV